MWFAHGLALAAVALASPAAAQSGGTGVGSQFELVFWQSVATSEDVGQYEAYLSRYPEGTFAPLARAKIERLRPQSVARASQPAQSQPAPPQPVPTQPVPTQAAAPSPASPSPASPPPAAAPAVATPIMPAPPAVSVAAAPPAPAPAPAIAVAPVAPAPTVAMAPPSAPVAAATPAALPAAAPAPATTPPPVPAPATTPGPAPSPAPAAPLTLAAQLAALAQSQGRTEPAAGASGPTRSLPTAPVLRSAEPVALPARFCSAVERNAFYDERFTPAKDAADENNRKAIAHLQALQRLYDDYGRQGDPDGQNAVAAESKAYQGIAATAYQASAAYEQLFQAMMAVPIADCAPPAPAKGDRPS
ncbi:hypothetical protein ACFOON_09285 [Novosphingobium piscinae]|uniref:Uncharacterized protein n=1 Tax=Novosphingobium piscinae TaxID=1507448 RepID=A0A7X1FY54_9SPHN|nr:hypothetical protein [Novosphingobium piscinae]MBC2669154.1 hypothetical protein [Novosphingobium piscinae]